jgi:acetyltransferase-like isoleucine patch superfamily enzyme
MNLVKKALLNGTSLPVVWAIKFLGSLSAFLLRSIRLAKFRAGSCFPVPTSTQFDGGIQVLGTGRIEVGEYCRFGPNVVLETQGNGVIRLGNHVRVNAGTHIVAHFGISIGDDVLIGEYVSIRDANHGMQMGQPMRAQAHQGKPITIKRDAWIARGCCVLQGAQMGEGSVLGANSLLNTPLPAMAVAVGSPARIIKDRKARVVADS